MTALPALRRLPPAPRPASARVALPAGPRKNAPAANLAAVPVSAPPLKPRRGADYTAADVQILGPIEGIRKRPSQYLGDNGAGALTHMAREGVDNAIDEHRAGRNNFVGIMIRGRTVIVCDHGGGIPIEKHAKTGKSVLEEVFLNVHAGGKFGSDAYADGSIGTHGIGMTAVSALSSQMQVWTFRNGAWYSIITQKGLLVQGLHKAAPPVKQARGTVVQFTPDPTCFESGAAIDPGRLRTYLDLLGYLNPGCRIVLNVDGTTNEYTQTSGLEGLLAREMERVEVSPIMPKPVSVRLPGIDLVLTWVNSGEENVSSYVNTAVTADGGVHVNGMNKALLEALAPFKGKREYTAADLRAGLFCIVNVNVKEPLFTGQTKEKLRGSSVADVEADVYNALRPALDEFFAGAKGLAAEIVKRAETAAKLRASYAEARRALKDLNSPAARAAMSRKLAWVTEKNPDNIELFLVEGDSAGGTAKDSRDRLFQAVLPLRGKMLNAAKSDKWMANPVIRDVITACGGLDNKGEYDDRTRRVGRVVLLADPDIDGEHITVLLLTLFHQALPQFFRDGRVYVVNSQLFNCQYNGRRYFGDSVEAVLAQLKGGRPKDGVQRIKGWGEVKAPVLGPAAFDVETRKLFQIEALDEDDGVQFVALVGDGVAERRKLLGV